MKYLLFFLLCALSVFGYSQSTVYLKADTVTIEKTGGAANLKIKNATRYSINGVLINIGNGVTKFQRIRAINDSQFTVGTDTITIAGATGGGGGGGEDFAVFKNADVTGHRLLDDWSIADTSYLKRIEADEGTFINIDTTEARKLIFSLDTAGLIDLIGGVGTLAELTDVDIVTTPPEEGWYLAYDEGLEKWIAREPQNVYPIMVGDSLKLTNGTDTSSGVFIDGGGCATCWDYVTGNSPGAAGFFGTLDNNDIHIYTNNTKFAEFTNNQKFLLGTATEVSNFRMVVADSAGFDYVRIGGVVTPAANNVGLNARLVIKGSGTTSTTATFAVLNSASTQMMSIRDDGSFTMPPIFGSITSTGIRMAGASTSWSVGNGAGTTGFLHSFTGLSTTTNIGVTTSGLIRLHGTYQEISPYDDAGNYHVVYSDYTFNGTSGKGPGYVASFTSKLNLTAIPDARGFNTIDSTYTYSNGALHMANTKAAGTGADFTVAKEHYFIMLPDLTSAAANRNLVLSDPLTNGRILIVFNTNSDASFKWSFSGETVRKADGTTITTIPDGTSTFLIYNYGEWLATSTN